MNEAMRGNRAMRRLALVAIAAIMTFGWVGHEAKAQPPADRYFAFLTGNQEVPPVMTSAFSFGSFMFLAGDTAFVGVRYNFGPDFLTVDNIHIHEAAIGVDGPVVLQMRPTDFLTEGFCLDFFGGLITYYYLTKEALRGSLEGQTLADLRALMNTGNTYINLHTPVEPEGWIRGQMIPLP